MCHRAPLMSKKLLKTCQWDTQGDQEHTHCSLFRLNHTHTHTVLLSETLSGFIQRWKESQTNTLFYRKWLFFKNKTMYLWFFFFKKRSMFWVELMDLGFSVTDITLLVWFFIWDLLIIIILQNTPDLSFKAFLTPSSYFYMLTYKKSNLNVVHLQHVGSACEILTVCSRRKKLKSPPPKKEDRTSVIWL